MTKRKRRRGDRPGPLNTTGKFTTRSELEQAIRRLRQSGSNIKSIAAECRVSVGTVYNVLKAQDDKVDRLSKRSTTDILRECWRKIDHDS